jgi:hypothetical protein
MLCRDKSLLEQQQLDPQLHKHIRRFACGKEKGQTSSHAHFSGLGFL